MGSYERVSVGKSIVILTVSIIWTFIVGLRMLWTIIKKGPRNYFHVARRDARPSDLDDEKYGQHRFARLKKIRLHYVSAGDESKPLLLFVHGFPEFWYSWRHQLTNFASDYHAVAVDMRGYGESEKPVGMYNYTLDKLVGDLRELVPALGHKTCTVVGHDWGGLVSWEFAHMYPDVVERVVVSNCPCYDAFFGHVLSNRAQFFKSWYMFFFQMPWLPEALFRSEDLKTMELMFRRVKGITEDDIEMYKYTHQPAGALTGPMNYYRAALQLKNPLHRPTDKIQVPSLMIWGTRDHALGRELATLTGNYVQDYRVEFLEGATHWVPQERPHEVNALIREFIQCEEADK